MDDNGGGQKYQKMSDVIYGQPPNIFLSPEKCLHFPNSWSTSTSTSMINNFSIFSIFQTQQQGGAVKYSGPVDVAKSLYREGGMRSIYKGTVATLLRGKNDLTSQH